MHQVIGKNLMQPSSTAQLIGLSQPVVTCMYALFEDFMHHSSSTDLKGRDWWIDNVG